MQNNEGKEIIELRTLRKERRGYMQYVFSLRARGVIGAYVSEAGYAAFCPEEVEAFQKKTRRGRPLSRKSQYTPVTPETAGQYEETRRMLESLMADISKTKKGE